jgi:hypothetical protein
MLGVVPQRGSVTVGGTTSTIEPTNNFINATSWRYRW